METKELLKAILPYVQNVADWGNKYENDLVTEIKRRIALLEIQEKFPVKLIPVELTRAMREAFNEAHEEWNSGDDWRLDCPDHQWGAMLSAAPKLEYAVIPMRLIANFQELNMNNFNTEDVERLNG